MSERDPRLEDLVGDDVQGDERHRLQAVHDLLLQVGPPPELSPALREPPAADPPRLLALPRRYRFTAAAAAAAAAMILFGAGYVIGGRGGPAPALRTVEMRGPGGAAASLAVFAQDEAGNWPMKLTVSGLAVGKDGAVYELWLTKNGRLAEPCGAFAVAKGTTEVPLNAPYALRQFDGWVIVRSGSTVPLLSTV